MTGEMQTMIVRHALRLLAQQPEAEIRQLAPWLTVSMVRDLAIHYPLHDPEYDATKRLVIDLADKEQALLYDLTHTLRTLIDLLTEVLADEASKKS